MDETAEALPTVAFIELHPSHFFDDKEPMPLLQLFQDLHRAEFSIPDHKNDCPSGDQFMHSGHKSQVLISIGMSYEMPDPRPDEG